MPKENVNKAQIMKTIMPVIEKAAEFDGLLPVETDFVQEAGQWTLKVFLYNPATPITHADCENITKKIESVLEELIPVQFRLEVSSPGTERKLKSDKEYGIFKGERVKVKLKKSAQTEPRTFLAKIKDYKESDGLLLETLDPPEEIKIKNEDISSVKLEPEYEFNKKKK